MFVDKLQDLPHYLNLFCLFKYIMNPCKLIKMSGIRTKLFVAVLLTLNSVIVSANQAIEYKGLKYANPDVFKTAVLSAKACIANYDRERLSRREGREKGIEDQMIIEARQMLKDVFSALKNPKSRKILKDSGLWEIYENRHIPSVMAEFKKTNGDVNKVSNEVLQRIFSPPKGLLTNDLIDKLHHLQCGTDALAVAYSLPFNSKSFGIIFHSGAVDGGNYNRGNRIVISVNSLARSPFSCIAPTKDFEEQLCGVLANTDEQFLWIVGHELGHGYLNHSYHKENFKSFTDSLLNALPTKGFSAIPLASGAIAGGAIGTKVAPDGYGLIGAIVGTVAGSAAGIAADAKRQQIQNERIKLNEQLFRGIWDCIADQDRIMFERHAEEQADLFSMDAMYLADLDYSAGIQLMGQEKKKEVKRLLDRRIYNCVAEFGHPTWDQRQKNSVANMISRYVETGHTDKPRSRNPALQNNNKHKDGSKSESQNTAELGPIGGIPASTQGSPPKILKQEPYHPEPNSQELPLKKAIQIEGALASGSVNQSANEHDPAAQALANDVPQKNLATTSEDMITKVLESLRGYEKCVRNKSTSTASGKTQHKFKFDLKETFLCSPEVFKDGPPQWQVKDCKGHFATVFLDDKYPNMRIASLFLDNGNRINVIDDGMDWVWDRSYLYSRNGSLIKESIHKQNTVCPQ